MESIITSFKKRQRQIIDTFVFGFNTNQTDPSYLEVVESETKDELKLMFYQNEDGRNVLKKVVKLNLLDYQLNDWRVGAVVERLRRLIWSAEEINKPGGIKSQPDPIDDEDVRYELFYQKFADADRPYCLGLSVVGVEDEIPLMSYGKTLLDAFEGLTKYMKENNFIITMAEPQKKAGVYTGKNDKDDQWNAINLLSEMCQESLDPKQYEQWDEIKEQLIKTRTSLR